MPADRIAPAFPYVVVAYAQMFNLGHVHRQIVRDANGEFFWRLIPRDAGPGEWCKGDPRHPADVKPSSGAHHHGA